MQGTLLIELLTEELPPKALKELADVFAAKVFANQRQLIDRRVERP